MKVAQHLAEVASRVERVRDSLAARVKSDEGRLPAIEAENARMCEESRVAETRLALRHSVYTVTV